MRFPDRVTFVYVAESKYNPLTGNYVESDPVPTTLPCLVVSMSASMSMQTRDELFGMFEQPVSQITLRRKYTKPFTYILFNGKRYESLGSTTMKKSAIFVKGDLLGSI